MRPGPALGAALVLVVAGAAAGQEPWWERPDARADARRALTLVRDVMTATERGDARPAAAALTDASWVVRLFAAVRLEALGLDRPTARLLRDAADPGRGAPEPGWDAVRKAREFAAALEVELGPPPEVSEGDALRIVCSVVTERLRTAPDAPGRKQRVLEGALALRAALGEAADRAWLASWLLAYVDPDACLADLRARGVAQAVAEDGAKVFAWYADNARFLYWHAADRRFLVDQEARAAKASSEEHRKRVPWPAGEGPDAPSRKGDQGGR